MNISRIIHFLNIGIWRDEKKEKGGPIGMVFDCVRTLYLAIRYFIERGHTYYATALSFSTMLATVPVVAVLFAIARGFGLDAYITQWIYDTLSAQPQVAEYIINLAGSYLAHAKSGIIIGIGLVFMLYSVLSLIYNIEAAFDEIWQVKDNRSPLRLVTDYTSLLFLVPITLILISGVNIFVYKIVDHLQAYILLGSMVKFLIKLLPFVLMSCVFTALYVFMPNTKVKFSKAVIPGTIAGIAMLLLQYFYINCQVFLTSYNAIYGSFAALPLFMLWLMISWYICLFGAELCYMSQNSDYYAFMTRTEDISHDMQTKMCMMLMTLICKRFAEGKAPYTALELKEESHIPIRITSDLLHKLCDIRLLSENTGSNGDMEATYQPAQDIANITVGTMINKLEEYPQRHKLLEVQPENVLSKKLLETYEEQRKQFLDEISKLPLR